MQGTTLSFSNIHHHGELFGKIMEARRPTHLPKDWGSGTAARPIFDQYDTPQSRWLAVQDDEGDILASLRLTPTIAQSGIYSYMIRDAQNGLLDDVPSDLLHDTAPVAEDTWEMTRAKIKPGLYEVDRQVVRQRLIEQIIETTKTEGIARLVAMLPLTWKDWAEQSDFAVKEAGRIWETGGRKLQAHWLGVQQTAA